MGDASVHRVLVVDDDPRVLRATVAMLQDFGFDVAQADCGENAVSALVERDFDVILTDIQMPGMSGIEFLRAVRTRDLDVPVLLMTGDPSVTTAVDAIEYGALGYVIKPMDFDALAERLHRAATLHAIAKLKRQALEITGVGGMGLGDLAALESRFDSALEGLWMAFQPIVDVKRRTVVSYEALVRTDESTMARPDDLFAAAERLGRVHELGRTIRARVADRVAADDDALVFVNLHPHDLEAPELYGEDCPLHAVAPRIVLEITERASLSHIKDVVDRVHDLRVRGYRIAIDDLGAGYAGLSSFTQLEPDIVKLDMSLVRGIDQHSGKRRIVRAMVRLCQQLGVSVVGEGVETARERDTMEQLGCDWLQGYLFARPDRRFAAPHW